MPEVALTNIKHGQADGSVVWYDAGEVIQPDHFDEEALAALRESEAVGEPAVMVVADPETEALVAKLTADLAAMREELERNGLPIPGEE